MPSVISDGVINRGKSLSSASLHEAAGKIGALPYMIKPPEQNTHVCGRAFPIQCAPGSNLWLHRAIYHAEAGDVLVADVGGAIEFGYWGEVMAVAARARGIAGLVINGGVRDSRALVKMGFPVFSAAICIRGTHKDPNDPGKMGGSVVIGEVSVRHGDFVLGDADGVVVIPADSAEKAITEAEKRDADEKVIFERLGAGETTLSIYSLPE